jgi:hypothetical protein
MLSLLILSHLYLKWVWKSFANTDLLPPQFNDRYLETYCPRARIQFSSKLSCTRPGGTMAKIRATRPCEKKKERSGYQSREQKAYVTRAPNHSKGMCFFVWPKLVLSAISALGCPLNPPVNQDALWANGIALWEAGPGNLISYYYKF